MSRNLIFQNKEGFWIMLEKSSDDELSAFPGPSPLVIDHRGLLLDLVGNVLNLVKEGKRNPAEVVEALRVMNDHQDFARRLGLNSNFDFVKHQLRQSQLFYYENFNLDKSFADLRIPSQQDGFNKLLVIAKEVDLAKLIEKMNILMPIESHIPKLSDVLSDRQSEQDYAIWVKSSCEAPEEYANLSFNDFKKLGVKGITLLERLLYEMEFFLETRRHLDAQQRTLCVGSRRLGNGFSVAAYWILGRLRIRWCDVDYRDENLRARSVIL